MRGYGVERHFAVRLISAGTPRAACPRPLNEDRRQGAQGALHLLVHHLKPNFRSRCHTPSNPRKTDDATNVTPTIYGQ